MQRTRQTPHQTAENAQLLISETHQSIEHAAPWRAEQSSRKGMEALLRVIMTRMVLSRDLQGFFESGTPARLGCDGWVVPTTRELQCILLP